MSDIDPQLLDELRTAVARDPGDADYPVLAELLRRAGRLDEAETVVTEGLLAAPDSLAGRCALLLILDDRGRREQLRGRLEAWTGEAVSERLPDAVPTAGAKAEAGAAQPAEAPPLSEAEFEQAFATAEPELEAMVTPDSVAEEAALRVDGSFGSHNPLEESPTFATRTMAELLERQGDAAGAARIRAALDQRVASEASAPEPPEAAPAAGAGPGGRFIATLERWLGNARRLQA